MARRKQKAKRNRRGSRALKRKPTRAHARRGANPRKRPRKPPGRRLAPAQRPRKSNRKRRKSGPRLPTVRIPPLKSRIRTRDSRIEAAVLEMNRGRSLTEVARPLSLTRADLQSFLRQRGLLIRKGKRWVFKDDRPRRVQVMTGGRKRNVIVRGYEQASLLGEYHHAVGKFLESNDTKFLKPFRGRSVQAANGRRHDLETDPNALHRIAAMDSPAFHEIYEFTSNT